MHIPMPHATDIVGYHYQADFFTPPALVEHLIDVGIMSPAARGLTPEQALDQWAMLDGIDRTDETTFDTGDFPKVVFRTMTDEGES